jgi:hypothetical protein
MDGEAIFDIFFLIKETPGGGQDIPVPRPRLRDCCSDFSLRVLADTEDSDQFKNDTNGFLWWFDDVIDAAALKLQKFQDGEFADIAELNDDTFGKAFLYKFFTNSQGEKFVGYQIKWRNVLAEIGEGSYRVACETSSILGETTLYSPDYCLNKFTPERAEGTIKIEYYNSRQQGLSDNDEKFKDFGDLNWYDSMRLPGYFGFPSADYQKDYVKYQNGQQVWVQDEQEPEFLLKIRTAPYFVHEKMRTDVMQADRILITDYNSKNPGRFIQKKVQCTSGYAPDWRKLKSRLAPVELTFKQEFNNLKKKRC